LSVRVTAIGHPFHPRHSDLLICADAVTILERHRHAVTRFRVILVGRHVQPFHRLAGRRLGDEPACVEAAQRVLRGPQSRTRGLFQPVLRTLEVLKPCR
jgi:hypothetical protein